MMNSTAVHTAPIAASGIIAIGRIALILRESQRDPS
jgi:hypothetical protein